MLDSTKQSRLADTWLVPQHQRTTGAATPSFDKGVQCRSLIEAPDQPGHAARSDSTS